MLGVLLLWQIFFADARICLPEAISEAQRQNITLHGVSGPILLAAGDWDSALAGRDTYSIIVSEVMGYNIDTVYSGGTTSTLRFLGGCGADESGVAVPNCSFPPVTHVGFEIWGSTLSSDAWINNIQSMGEKRPTLLGSMGYSGVEGLYVMGRARQASQDANGVHLSYYGNLNASWFNPATYAATVSDVNISLLKTCVQWTNDALAPQLYLDATGDADGVMDVNGTKFFKCYQDKWWAPPACRANPTTCLSSVTGGTGWGLTELVQQAFFHNIPVAFALAESSATYRVINKEIQSFMYWWMPDSSFVQYDPTLVEFPPFNFAEYRDGIFKSQIGVIELSIATAAGFELAADRAFALADNMLLSDSVMSGMLLDFVNAGSSDMWQTACDWLKANRNIWEGWVPDQTKCNPGLGLVDLQGDFTESLTGAVSCAICPAGRASMELGDTDTRVCSLCPAGTYQSTFRASECMSCELGKIAETEGMTECQDCGLGEYANATGMSSCYRCGAGTGQEDLWTTSKEVTSDGKVVVLQLLGASSQSLCACDAGSFLWEGRCEVCTEGATCPGANRLELMPGYYSTPDLPGEVYNCYSEQTCPGGVPGTCAAGRDSSSVACAECLEGYQEREDRSCGPCREGDYAFFVLVVAGFVGIVVLVYVVLKNEKTGKDRSSLLMMASGLAQCITVIQILSVIRRFNIDWREPFRSVLIFMEVLSLDVDMFSVSCIGRLNPVSLFGARAMMIPMFLGAALVVHLFWLLISRSKSFRVADLLRTCGTIFMVLFIVLFSVLLAPFQCNLHPNGSYTVKRYPTVFCDGTGQHTEMFWLGGFACLMPISFLVVCSYVVLVEMPKRVAKSDAPFLAAISFLTKRFRPGMEMSSVWLLVRNAAVVATPLLYTTAAQLLMMSVILALNLTLVASYKPWRFMVCNWLDNLLLCGLLIIVQVGSVTVENSDPQATMVVAMTFLTIMTLGVLSIVLLSGYKYFQQKFRKQFRFFTCHQKSAAGSMARLLKMELEQRLPGTKTFLDCDDLNDLTRLFSYVGQDTETFLVLCSPAILTRKWCVGEMVTARANKVSTLLLAWGDFSLPDERFIDNYPNVVPDITELVKHGITLADVEDTFRWLRVQNQVPMPEMVTPTTFATVASELCAVSSSESSQKAVSVFGHETFTNFPILVDPYNSESVATAMILAVMLKPRLVGTEFPLPSILKLDAEVPKNATLSIIICTNTCFKSEQMQSWLLQACSLDDCCMMPVIADDPFMMPSDAFWADMRSTSSLEETQLRLYSLVVQCIFQEIAVVFVPQGYFSTQDDLELRANQAASRLTAKLQPLKDKVEKLERLQQSEKGEGGETLEAIEELKNEAAVSQDTTLEGDGEEAGPEPPMITQTF